MAEGTSWVLLTKCATYLKLYSQFVCSNVLLTLVYCVQHDFALTDCPLLLSHVSHMLSGTTNGEDRGRRHTGSHKRRREEEDDEQEAGMFLFSERI